MKKNIQKNFQLKKIKKKYMCTQKTLITKNQTKNWMQKKLNCF